MALPESFKVSPRLNNVVCNMAFRFNDHQWTDKADHLFLSNETEIFFREFFCEREDVKPDSFKTEDDFLKWIVRDFPKNQWVYMAAAFRLARPVESKKMDEIFLRSNERHTEWKINRAKLTPVYVSNRYNSD